MAENNESVQEMLRDAEVAEEPGNIRRGSVVGSSNGMTMTATELSSAGWVYVYNVRTGDRSIVNRNMLEQQLQKRFDDGTFAFSTKKPEGVTRVKGKIKCLLHKDDPNRNRYDQMGLPYCIKANINTSHDLTVHMQKRHRREWASIDGERQEKEKIRERERENQLADAIKLLAESNANINNQGNNNAKK
jgi:hypothetical protein